MISVVIPLYNKEESILSTVNLVLSQTYREFELLIVDDGSTDGSVSHLSKIDDSRLRIICKSNGGVSSARNRGISESKYNYIAFLDADDEWELDYLQTIIDLIRKYPGNSIFATGFAFKINNKVVHAQKEINGVVENYFEIAMTSPVVHSSAVCIKKSVFNSVSGFDERISHGEDLELWARLAKGYKFVIDGKIKSYYTRGLPNQATSFMPSPTKSIVNYLDFERIDSLWEKRYYKKLIISRFYSYIKRKQFDHALTVYRRYRKFIFPSDYISFLYNKALK